MSKSRDILRRAGRFGLWTIVVLLTLFILQVTVLAFPQFIVSEKSQFGTVTIYTEEEPGTDIDGMAKEVENRLRGCGFYDASRANRVFYFQDPNLYKLFARLAMVTPKVQGFALSVFGNSYVDASRIIELAGTTGGTPKYGIWEGSPAHTIAHEIGHIYISDRIGMNKWKKLPHWKQEGFPEYIANIALIRQDSLATLQDRIKVLNDWEVWGWSNRWDRIHYKAELLVEFLLDIKGYTTEQIVADSVTLEETLSELMEWAESQNDVSQS